jgi:DNA primase
MDISAEVLKVAHNYLSKVKRSGPENVMAICPFHTGGGMGGMEQHPSFAMSLTKGLYFCHACGEKGNLLSFLRALGINRTEIEFRYRFIIDEAAKNLPPKPDPLNPGVIDLNPIPEAVLGLLDYCPNDLVQNGFLETTLQRFDVGFDMQHMRVTFPFRDLKGNLMGISGRAVNDDAWPRYKVYTTEYKIWDLPERPVIDKRAVLYNAQTVYPMVYFAPPGVEVVLVEGFKACMWIWQAGIKNVVALLGTYLSWEQQWILERMGGTVYLFLDNDEYGILGTRKAGEKLSKSLHVRVMQYPKRLVNEESQPDDCTPAEILQSKETAMDYFQWLAA